jgi:hypothetical protein
MNRPSLSCGLDTSRSVPVTFRYRRPSSLPSVSLWSKDGDDLSTENASIWSSAVGGSSLAKGDSSNGSESDSKGEEQSISDNSAPEIDFKIKSERKFANARLCDVLRTLFGSNG